MTIVRESNFIKFLCVLLASSLLYLSCSSDYISNKTGCSDTIDLADIDYDLAVKNMENMLDYARSVDHQENYNSFGQFHATLFGKSEQALKYVSTFEKEGKQYANLGFEGYVKKSEHISDDFKQHLLNYSKDLLGFLEEQPDLVAFTKFMNGNIDKISKSDLCENDKKIMTLYLSASQGYANWFYKHFFSEKTASLHGESIIDLRGCSFWEAIGCGLLSILVGTVVTAISTILLVGADLFVDGKQVSNDDQLAIFAGVALGLYVGYSVYDWCCGRDEVPQQDCYAPTGHTFIQTGCNQFVCRIFGSSNYGTTDWGSYLNCTQENTSPLSAITPTPRFQFSVPVLGSPSTLCAIVSCIKDGSTLSAYSWGPKTMTFESDVNYFPLQWTSAPPQVFPYFDNTNEPGGIEGDDNGFENILFAALNTPSNDVMTYDWSISGSHTIISGGTSNDNAVSILLTSATDVTISVTATNTCTNQAESISATTIVQ